MKRMTRKLYGILILSMLATSAHAGWLSNLGQRIVNGAANTVQSNISGKINRTIDNAMDGKLAPQQKNSKSPGDNIDGYPEVSAGGPTSMIENQVDSSGMLSLEQVRKRALPFKGVYEEIDLGTFKFRGERLYGARLMIGEQMKAMDFYLMPGLYMFCFIPKSYNANVSVVGKHEGEGVELGYGLKTKKSIEDIGFYEMNLNKGATIRIVEASKNGGHFEMAMFNDTSKMGAMEFTLFKIPDTTVKK